MNKLNRSNFSSLSKFRDAAPHGSYEIVINKVQAGDAGNYSVKVKI